MAREARQPLLTKQNILGELRRQSSARCNHDSNLVQWGANNEVVSTDNTALAKPQRRQVTALDSSDESDFEILETDDFK